jgi:hypothetical protein
VFLFIIKMTPSYPHFRDELSQCFLSIGLRIYQEMLRSDATFLSANLRADLELPLGGGRPRDNNRVFYPLNENVDPSSINNFLLSVLEQSVNPGVRRWLEHVDLKLDIALKALERSYPVLKNAATKGQCISYLRAANTLRNKGCHQGTPTDKNCLTASSFTPAVKAKHGLITLNVLN